MFRLFSLPTAQQLNPERPPQRSGKKAKPCTNCKGIEKGDCYKACNHKYVSNDAITQLLLLFIFGSTCQLYSEYNYNNNNNYNNNHITYVSSV